MIRSYFARRRRQQALAELESRDRRPSGVMVQVSARCNMGCVMCGYVDKTPNRGFIDPILFGHILNSCRAYGVETIFMETAWGEPMLHPDIFQLLEMACRTFRVVLSTNITPLNPRRIAKLADAGLHMLQLSFCGYDKASYEAIYRGGKFEHVTANLCQVLKDFAGKSTKLLVNGVAPDDLIAFKTDILLWNLGFAADQREIKLAHNFGGLVAGSRLRRAHQLDLCSVLVNNPGIYIDGVVTACGCIDNSRALVIGDIKAESLRDIRYGARYSALLERFVAGNLNGLELCEDCDVPYCGSRTVSLYEPRTAA